MVGAGAVGAALQSRLDSDPAPPQRASEVALDIGAARADALPEIDVAGVTDYVAPSVVTISADIDNPLEGQGQSVGTGVIITSDGEVLTNAHVVENAVDVRVRLVGESEPRAATVLASDPGNDLALLRIAGDDFVPATFAAPGATGIGDEVVAIGFALDLDGGPSVTLGIVSALGRTIQTGPNEFLDGLIQTDAAISSGNSGGPLVNAAGEVVGINTAVARGDFQTAASNIGFAISVGEALPVVDQLRDQATERSAKTASSVCRSKSAPMAARARSSSTCSPTPLPTTPASWWATSSSRSTVRRSTVAPVWSRRSATMNRATNRRSGSCVAPRRSPSRSCSPTTETYTPGDTDTPIAGGRMSLTGADLRAVVSDRSTLPRSHRSRTTLPGRCNSQLPTNQAGRDLSIVSDVDGNIMRTERPPPPWSPGCRPSSRAPHTLQPRFSPRRGRWRSAAWAAPSTPTCRLHSPVPTS